MIIPETKEADSRIPARKCIPECIPGRRKYAAVSCELIWKNAPVNEIPIKDTRLLSNAYNITMENAEKKEPDIPSIKAGESKVPVNNETTNTLDNEINIPVLYCL